MLGTIVDKVQSLFSKGFLLGAFFPVLIFTLLNAVIAYYGLAPAIDGFGTINELLNVIGTGETVLSVTVLIAIGIIAYLLSTFTDVFRRLLEGQYFANWPWLWELIMNPVREDVVAKQRALNSARGEWRRCRQESNARKSELDDARRAGNAGGGSDANLVEAARIAFEAVNGHDPSEPTYENSLFAAVQALVTALTANRTENPAPAQRDNANKLADFYRVLTEVEIERWTERARAKFNSAWSDLYDNYVPDDLYPTRLGNIRAVTESYSEKTYGVRFDYLWPRLQPVILKSKDLAPLVELAKAHLDFAVLMLSLAISTTAFWLVALPFLSRSPWLFVIVGIVGPLLITFCYLLVEESQVLFGVLMQSSIDIFRLDVLPLMHQPAPDTLASERLR
jgi:hypothetical protein